MLVTHALESLMKGKKVGDGSGGSTSSSKKKPSSDSGDRGQTGGSGKKNERGKEKKHRKFDILKVRCYNCNEFVSLDTFSPIARSQREKRQILFRNRLMMSQHCSWLRYVRGFRTLKKLVSWSC
jgi:hypothetical protein